VAVGNISGGQRGARPASFDNGGALAWQRWHRRLDKIASVWSKAPVVDQRRMMSIDWLVGWLNQEETSMIVE